MTANFTPEYTNYKKTSPFKFFCQRVMPLVYDESLSYYELLCKTVDYLNNVIADLSTVETNTDELLNAYNQLQSYVNEYFSALDIQTEINNKLDAMVEDGTLENVLNRFAKPLSDRMDTLEERMTTFASLPPNATSGDAELADIRTPVSNFNGGANYSSAGDAVRGQIGGLVSETYMLVLDTDNLNASKLSEVHDCVMFVAGYNKWTDTPTGQTGVFKNKRYSGSYDLQEFYSLMSDNIFYRIVDRRDGTVYKEWSKLTSEADLNAYLEIKTDISKYSTETFLSHITDNVVFGASYTRWNDTPKTGVSGVFENKHYTGNYSIQTFTDLASGDVYTRIVNVDFSVYRNWVKLAVVGEALTSSGVNINSANSEEICENSFNNLPINTCYAIADGSAILENSPLSNASGRTVGGFVYTLGKAKTLSTGTIQVYISKDGLMYTRLYWTSWGAWCGNTPPLKVLAIGDSICRGYRNNSKGFVGDLGLPYKNDGVAGASISTVVSSVTNIPAQLIGETAFNPDIIICEGGINDYFNNAPLGFVPSAPATNDTEASALNKGTVAGGLAYTFYQMIKKYPKAQRFFIGIHKIKDSTHGYLPNTQNSAGYTQTELTELCYAICRLYNVKIIDVFNEGVIDTAFSAYVSPTPYSSDASVTNVHYVDNDGVHPLAYGYIQGYKPLILDAIKTGTTK